MRTIGLTGGIATGKSTVAELLRRLGAQVIDADAAAREVVAPGTEGLARITARFGAGVLASDGSLQRAALGALVFADAAARADLEAITHPLIRLVMAQQIAEAQSASVPLVAVDIPLLYESHREADFDGVLLVYCTAAVQRNRLRQREGLSATAIEQRLAAQLPIDDKRDRARWLIDNSGTRSETSAQVNGWWRAWVTGDLGNDG